MFTDELQRVRATVELKARGSGNRRWSWTLDWNSNCSVMGQIDPYTRNSLSVPQIYHNLHAVQSSRETREALLAKICNPFSPEQYPVRRRGEPARYFLRVKQFGTEVGKRECRRLAVSSSSRANMRKHIIEAPYNRRLDGGATYAKDQTGRKRGSYWLSGTRRILVVHVVSIQRRR